MAKLILLNKPYGVVCQFSGEGRTLKDLVDVPGVYPAGRLDADSEGLLVLTDDGAAGLISTRTSAQDYLAQWRHRRRRSRALRAWSSRMTRRRRSRHRALPGRAIRPSSPRNPDDRLELIEGRNRQVRRMTAAVGLPTLRLVLARRTLDVEGLAPGEWKLAR
jgi:23S rRNA pseudouridine2457 synthase